MIDGFFGQEGPSGIWIDAVVGDDAPNSRQGFGSGDAVGGRNLVGEESRIVRERFDVTRQFRREKRFRRHFQDETGKEEILKL